MYLQLKFHKLKTLTLPNLDLKKDFRSTVIWFYCIKIYSDKEESILGWPNIIFQETGKKLKFLSLLWLTNRFDTKLLG